MNPWYLENDTTSVALDRTFQKVEKVLSHIQNDHLSTSLDKMVEGLEAMMDHVLLLVLIFLVQDLQSTSQRRGLSFIWDVAYTFKYH